MFASALRRTLIRIRSHRSILKFDGSGSDPMLYEIMMMENTYSSFIVHWDVTVTITDVVVDYGTPPEFAVMDGVFDGF